MSYSKRKRTLSEKHEVQLSLERRQQIQKLFEKKFRYRKPADGSWCLPKDVCSGEIDNDEQHKHEASQSQPSNKSCDVANQSQPSNKACDANVSESLEKSGDRCENSVSVLKQIWTEEKYIQMKNALNELKNNLNDKDLISWHHHTRSVNLAGRISAEIQHDFRPELCTQAWCKFYEIATTYLDLEEKEFLFSVHLCEAPGAFVTSLNHYMLSTEYQGDWDWIATTLNPYYEGNDNGHMIGDDRLIRHTGDNWYFGVDNTGNLMSERNLEGLKKLIGDRQVDLVIADGSIDCQGDPVEQDELYRLQHCQALAALQILSPGVTADGSIDCQGDPGEQEDVVSRLQHCEALTALQILSPGGDFVLKMFTMLECKAVSLMYLLNCVFDEVHVFKPCTSKGGNSEVYVVCQKFKGMNDSYFLKMVSSVYFDREPDGCIFSRSQIPASFLSQLTECNSFFKELQMASIQRNLDLYRELSEEESQILESEKQFCMECFLQRYKLVPMVHQWRVMKYKKKPQIQTNSTSKVSSYEKRASSRENEGRFCGSFDDRLLQFGLPWKQKVKEYKTYNIAEEEFESWIENPHGQIVSSELEKFQIAFGEPVKKLASSRFCYGKLIQQTQEIFHNVKWFSAESPKMKEELREKREKKLMAVLASHKSDDGQGKPLETEEQDEELTSRPPLQRYSVCCMLGLDEKFELNEQRRLLAAVRSIIETCGNGGCVIIEMRSCLTRMTAGLVYFLYRCFHKIGFLSYHGDILKQNLVCLNYTQSDVQDYFRKVFSAGKNEAGFSKLEVVPISHLLDDREFCSFLQTANTRLLQSFITTVVEQERTLLVENTAIT